MFENLRKLYAHYGGVKSIAKSGYFWTAIFFAALAYKSALDSGWADIALAALPSLTGFTIAAYAIIFAILEPKTLKILMVKDEAGRSPVTSIASAIGHAVVIQIAAIVLAISVKITDLTVPIGGILDILKCTGYTPDGLLFFIECVKISISALGLVLTFYGILLILAAILSIVRMQIIVAPSKSEKETTRDSN